MKGETLARSCCVRRSRTFPRSSRSRELDQGYIPDRGIRILGFSALCAGLVSHGWQEFCILAETAVVDRENL